MKRLGSASSPFDGQLYSKAHDLGNSGAGTVTVDWDNGNVQTLLLTGSPTIAFSNGQGGGVYKLEISTGSGGFAVAWPSITWLRSSGTAPVLPTAASKKVVVTVLYDGAGYVGSYGDSVTGFSGDAAGGGGTDPVGYWRGW